MMIDSVAVPALAYPARSSPAVQYPEEFTKTLTTILEGLPA